MTALQVFQSHFARMWATRNDERVHVFANGHVWNRAERRKSIRMNIQGQRNARKGAS